MATNNMINTAEPFGISAGGTGVASVTIAPTASAWTGWDANKNLSANSHINGYTTTATAAGTTTLTVGSTWQQFFTGSTTQTVTLPVTSTLALGQSFYIVNNSSGNVTVNSSGGNAVQVMAASTTLLVTCILTSGTTAASWAKEYVGAASGGTVSNGTINNLAYYAATGTTVSGLATANNGVLVTDGSGVPSISSTLPAFTTSSITFNPTTGGIVGTTTNDNTSAGNVGEFVSSQIVLASAVSLTNNVIANLTSISLTAGDWDVFGNAYFSASVGGTVFIGWVSKTSATLPDVSLVSEISYAAVSSALGFTVPIQRFSLSTTTTIYVSVYTLFATGTMTVCGGIYARRRR